MKTIRSSSKILFLFFAFLLNANCETMKSGEEKFPYVEFSFNAGNYNLTGISDIGMRFYSNRWPQDFDAKRILSYRTGNPENLCGRVTSHKLDTVFELIIDWPDKHNVGPDDIEKLTIDTVWSLSPEKGNWDKSSGRRCGKTFHSLLFTKDKEFLSDISYPGYVKFSEIKRKSDSTWVGTGTFQFSIHGSDMESRLTEQGNFKLEFYIGL